MQDKDHEDQVLQEKIEIESGGDFIGYSINKGIEYIEDNNKCQMWLPTGCGKSVIITKIVEYYLKYGFKFIYSCSLRSLRN